MNKFLVWYHVKLADLFFKISGWFYNQYEQCCDNIHYWEHKS